MFLEFRTIFDGYLIALTLSHRLSNHQFKRVQTLLFWTRPSDSEGYDNTGLVFTDSFRGCPLHDA